VTLALVRHGRTEWNRRRLMQGRSEIPLDAYGRDQADAAGRALGVAMWDRIVASPLARARETAVIVAAHLGGPEVELDARLTERDYGAAEGIPVAEAHERWPGQDYPGAEALADAAARGGAAMRDLVERGGSSVVVGHGTTLRASISSLTGEECPRILNGEIVLLEQAGGGFRARRLA